MNEIEVICDDIVVIHEGRIVAASPREELLRGPTARSRRASLEERYLALVGGR